MGGLKFGKDGDGNVGYYGADGSLIPFSGELLFYASSNGGKRNKKYISQMDTWSGVVPKGAKKTVKFAQKCNCILWMPPESIVTIDKGSVIPISIFTAGVYNPCPNYYVCADKGSTLTYTLTTQAWAGCQGVLANFNAIDFV